MKEDIKLSTEECMNGKGHTEVISVVNLITYSHLVFQRQPEKALEMLKEKAREMGASQVVGVRLVPMVDDRGINVMMAYGTITLPAREGEKEKKQSIHIIGKPNLDTQLLKSGLERRFPSAEIRLSAREDLRKMDFEEMSKNTTYVISGYEEILCPEWPESESRCFSVCGEDPEIMEAVQNIGACKTIDYSQIVRLMA